MLILGLLLLLGSCGGICHELLTFIQIGCGKYIRTYVCSIQIWPQGLVLKAWSICQVEVELCSLLTIKAQSTTELHSLRILLISDDNYDASTTPIQLSENKATSLRKREVILSKISIYIVFVFLFCHSLRIIPNMYEMIQTYTKVSFQTRHKTFTEKLGQ